MVLTLLSFLAIAAVAVAGRLDLNPRILNGENAKPAEIPYQVSLQSKEWKSHFCGGSVLNAKYVLTSARCVSGKKVESIRIVAKSVDLNDPKDVHDIEKIIVHENYVQYDSWKNDIALLKVKIAFVANPQLSFVPLPSPNEVVPTNSVAVVSGWGALYDGGPATNKLQKARVNIADQNYCKNAYKNITNVYDTHICAYDAKVQRGACNGDIGGPLTVNGKIVGIVSWSNGCALTNYPTVYTRVSSQLNWIKTHAV